MKRGTEGNRAGEREKGMMGTEQKSKVAYRKIDPWHSVRRPTVALVALFLFPFQPRSLDFLLGGGDTTR